MSARYVMVGVLLIVLSSPTLADDSTETLSEYVRKMHRRETVPAELVQRVDHILENFDSAKVGDLAYMDQFALIKAIAWRRSRTAAVKVMKVWDDVEENARGWLGSALFVSCFEWVEWDAKRVDVPKPGACDRDAAGAKWAASVIRQLRNRKDTADRDMKADERLWQQFFVLIEFDGFPPNVEALLEPTLLDVVFDRSFDDARLSMSSALALARFRTRPGIVKACIRKLKKAVVRWPKPEYAALAKRCGHLFRLEMDEDDIRDIGVLYVASGRDAGAEFLVGLKENGSPAAVDLLLDIFDRTEREPDPPRKDGFTTKELLVALLRTLLDEKGGRDRGAKWWRRRVEQERAKRKAKDAPDDG